MMKLVVFTCLVAVASAGNLFGGFIYPYAAPFVAPGNYRGPLSLAPGQPANVLGWDGRPLDTLEVNLDRAANLAKNLAEGHILKKRSAPVVAPEVPLAPLAYKGVFAYSALPYSALPYSALPYSAPINYGSVAPGVYAVPLAHK